MHVFQLYFVFYYSLTKPAVFHEGRNLDSLLYIVILC